MAGSAHHLITAEDFFKRPNHRRHEVVHGALHICEPRGGVHGRIAARLVARLHAHVEAHGLGTVLVEAGYILLRQPDTVRGPDISFISRARLAPERIPERFIPGAPDLAVEIRSPSNPWSAIEEKVADYFAGRVRRVWIVDPRGRQVVVRYPDGGARIVTEDGVLEGENVVPGFRCEVGDLMGAGRRRGSAAGKVGRGA